MRGGHASINRMDRLAQDGFEAVAAIAKKALGALEATEGGLPPRDALIAALDAIWCKAEYFGDEVNVKAECNYVRPSRRSRCAELV